MLKLTTISMIIAIISIVLACVIIMWYKNKTKATLRNLSQTLDNAVNGSFHESTYDESQLSSLEGKLNRFISISLAAEKDLAEEKNRINALISDISHQTKTPIANILLYSQLLSERSDLSLETMKMVNQITIQTEKLSFLTGSLVKTSRLEAGIISVSPTINSIHELIICAYEEVKAKAEEKNISITISECDFNAIFDKKWTLEALYNILDNGVKYTMENGTISIKVIAYELFCRIDVTDNGMGIPSKDLNNIFQRFYRCPSVIEYEGVGIGLFLAREIISKQDGYIKVKSQIGKGSTFSIFLPM